MPRYRLSTENLSDLVAYLEVLGSELDPGISAATITLGTLLPPKETAQGLREAIARTLKAYIDDLNKRGGIYNRKLLLDFEDLPRATEEPSQPLAIFLQRRVFALLSPYIAGKEKSVVRAVSEAAAPMIGPFTLQPINSPPHRQIFHVHSGMDGQARALARVALRNARPKAPVILVADDPTSVEAGEAVAEEWKRGGWAPEQVAVRGDTDDAEFTRLVNRLAGRQTDVLMYLGPAARMSRMAAEAAETSWFPRVYLPAALAGGAILNLPREFDGRVFLAFPFLAEDVSPSGQVEYERLKVGSNLPRDHRAAQIAVLAAARLLEEGLRRCGQQASRARLIEELERLEGFSTGYSRALTFGPNRRVGAPGAYIFATDIPGQRLRNLGWTRGE
jgi:ABC-type branched-subunit amino acid transport system substrate-binding protein